MRTLSKLLNVLLAAVVGMASSHAFAFGLALRAGPFAAGTGGTNPVTFVNPGEYELSYISGSKNWEINLSLIPGLTVGYRETFSWGGYVSVGPGVILDANGIGPGAYAAFGYDFWCPQFLCFSAEYKQGIALARFLPSPYAVRLGVSVWTN